MPQTFHKFKAETLDEAYRAMRRKLGDDAIVIHTTTINQGGVFGFLSRKMVEITASAPPFRPPGRVMSVPEKRYAASMANPDPAPVRRNVIGSDERVKETVEYFQQLVSDAQERMGTARPDPPRPISDGNAAVSPVVPFKKPRRKSEIADLDADMRKDVREMREMLQVLFAEIPGAGLPSDFVPYYRMLLDRGVSRKAAASLVAAAARAIGEDALRDARVFTERMKMEIRRHVRVTGGIALSADTCRVVALIGATGVGKTTNLAKLAALYSVRERARVALITADTYRVAAPDQLRVYANIIGTEMKIVEDAKDAVSAVRDFRDRDLILVDTAGSSPYNEQQTSEMSALLSAIQPDETMLLVSAATPVEDARAMLTRFSALNPTSLFFTKLDETNRFGALFCLAAGAGLPLSYFSTGQNVPDDIVLAHAGMVADLVLEGGDRRGRSSSKTA